MINIFFYDCWLCVCPSWKIYSDPLPIFSWVVLGLYKFFIYFDKPLIKQRICRYLLSFNQLIFVLFCWWFHLFCRNFFIWCMPICLFLLLFCLRRICAEKHLKWMSKSHFLLGIFLIKGPNPCLLYWWYDLPLSHQEAPSVKRKKRKKRKKDN